MDISRIDFNAAGLFTLAAIGLLGSPGPAIAALLAVGKVHGFSHGLRLFFGLQVGLGTAAAISAAGLVSLFVAAPFIRFGMLAVATAYLIYLAWQIGTAPTGQVEPETDTPPESLILAGVILGIANPKAYIAFASLMASYAINADNPLRDGTTKWVIIVIVMIVVDFLWLLLGVAIGRAVLPPKAERAINVLLGGMIAVAAATPFI